MSEVPAAYTPDSFKEFLRDELEATASVLGWTQPSHKAYANASRRTLRVLGQTGIAASNPIALEIVGPVEIWRGVMNETATDHNWSADGGSYSSEQVYKHAQEQFKLAMKIAIAAGYYPQEAMNATSSVMETRQRW